MERVRIGIIGFGVMGSKHGKYLVENAVSNAELTAVADIDQPGLKKQKISGRYLPLKEQRI